MKRKVLIFLLFLLSAAALAACGGTPEITVETESFDLGDVPNGTIAGRELTVQNTGTETLVVESLSTSCGCTTATLAPMQIAPGESGTLRVEFDAGAHGPELTGPMVRQIYINSNDPAQPEAIVELAVNITAPLASE